MEVNTQSLRCTEKRSVLDAINFTGALAYAHAAQDVSLLQSHVLGVFSSKSEQPEFQPVRFRYHVPASRMRVLLSHVLLGCYPLKIVGVIVRLVVILMMNEPRSFWTRKPTKRDDAMKKPPTTDFEISVGPFPRYQWRQLSQDFPAPRYGVEVIEHSILDSVVKYFHGVRLAMVELTTVGIIPDVHGVYT